MTPFEKAGYTKKTRFKILAKGEVTKVGDIAKIFRDDGSICPEFITEEGRQRYCFLPGEARAHGVKECLEVCDKWGQNEMH